MSISSHELYVVVTYISYSGICGDLDNMFADRKEAEDEAARMSAERLGSTSLKYSVMTLDDFIDELKSEARQEGAERERGAY